MVGSIETQKLQAVLLDLHDRLLSEAVAPRALVDELIATLSINDVAAAGGDGASTESAAAAHLRAYRAVVRDVRQAVRGVIPEDSTVLVMSKGDPALLELGGLAAWHFPCNDDGVYAGHYPADSAEAIDHLEALRRRGASYLLVPSPAFWWFEHYPAFEQHLARCYERVWSTEACVIVHLRPIRPEPEEIDFLADLAELLERTEQLAAEVRLSAQAAREQRLQRDGTVDRSIQGLQSALADSARVAVYSCEPPSAWIAGQVQSYTVTVTNTGWETWPADGPTPVQLGIHFGNASDAPHDGWDDDHRFALDGDVEPGGSQTLLVKLAPRCEVGTYVLRHRMVRDGVAWFDQIQRTGVTISPAGDA